MRDTHVSNKEKALLPDAELQPNNNNVELMVGASTTINIVSGNGSYKVAISPAGIAEVAEKENKISVFGNNSILFIQ